MGDREIIVGIGARDLRNVGKAIVDERNAGQIAARERTVDLGIVSRLDILVSMSRGCAKRESAKGEPEGFPARIDAPCRAKAPAGEPGAKRRVRLRYERTHGALKSFCLGSGSCSKQSS